MKLEVGQKLWYKDKHYGNLCYIEVLAVEQDSFIFSYNRKLYRLSNDVLGVRLFRSSRTLEPYTTPPSRHIVNPDTYICYGD